MDLRKQVQWAEKEEEGDLVSWLIAVDYSVEPCWVLDLEIYPKF